jgi:5-methylcytosine-specific restriction endonuclease McrA
VYPTFLQSRYWWLVKGLLLKARHDRCQDCGRDGPLDVHHLTYAHRGAEIWHLDDLALLCSLCHAQRHATVEVVEPENEGAS